VSRSSAALPVAVAADPYTTQQPQAEWQKLIDKHGRVDKDQQGLYTSNMTHILRDCPKLCS